MVVRGDAGDAELRNALRRVGLGEWLDTLPDGLSTVLVGRLLDEPNEHLDDADSGRC